MAFKFILLVCALGLANGSYIHGPMNHHYGSSTAQYSSQELRYPSSTGAGANNQGGSTQSESIIRGHGNGQSQLSSSQQKTVQISSGSYSSLAGQGKTDVHVTNPGTYTSNNYNGSPADASHEQQVSFASTPSYNSNNNNNGFEQHGSVSPSASYQQSTPVYGHNNQQGQTHVYGHHNVPVYRYYSSAYGLPHASNYQQNGNAYSQEGASSSGISGGPGIIGVPYSPAAAVSHMSYSSPVGISYAW